MKQIITIFLILLINQAFAQSETDFYTPPTNTGVTKDLVADYNAINTDKLDDSKVLQDAIDEVSALPNGGKITIPAGTYYLMEVKLASNVHLEFDEGVTIIPYTANTPGNYTVFSLGKNSDYIHNVKMSAKSGKFKVDFRNLDNDNGRVVSLHAVDNFCVGDFIVLDEITKFSTVTGGISEYDGEWLDPRNGVVKNINAYDMHYGYGVIQLQAGHNVFFKDLYGQGGVTLRLETGLNSMNKLQKGGVFDIYGKNIICEDGNAALMISPHAMKNGHVEIDGVTAINTGFAARIGNGYVTKEQDSLGITPGYYANTCKVSNVMATYGETAQVKSKHFKYMPCALRHLISEEYNPDGNSYSAPAVCPVLNGAQGNGPGYYTVTLTNVDYEGFEYLNKGVLLEGDAVEDCTTSVDSQSEQIFTVYPNPSQGVFYLNAKSSDNASYRIYTLTGILVEQASVLGNNTAIGQGLEAGVYLLSYTTGDVSSTVKIVKK